VPQKVSKNTEFVGFSFLAATTPDSTWGFYDVLPDPVVG